MSEIISVLVAGFALSFCFYWYIKFRHVLPLNTRLISLEKSLEKFIEFAKDTVAHVIIPDSKDHFEDIINRCLLKLHEIYPESTILTFEKVDKSISTGNDSEIHNAWKLISCLKNYRTQSLTSSEYEWDVLDNAAKDGTFHSINFPKHDLQNPVIRLIESCGINFLIVCSYMKTQKGFKRVIVFGTHGNKNSEIIKSHLGVAIHYMESLYQIYEKTLSFKKENEHIHQELNALLSELDATGTKLIQRARERKALYDVVTTLTTKSKDAKYGYSSILNIVARIMEADVVACLLFDEIKNQLVVQSGGYGIDDNPDLLYQIPVTNMSSSSVRTFLSGKPFITGNAQNDPEVISHYAKLWNIHSLMVVQIFTHGKPLGVLRVASTKQNFFSQDQLEFLNIIANEIGIIIEMMTLYDNLSKIADELAQSNKLKDEFLATVSHELKTPLTTIRGFVSLILSGEMGQLNKEQTDSLLVVDQSIVRLNALISDLLDLSRLTGKVEMELRNLNIEEIISRSIDNFMPKAKEKNIEISMKIDSPLSYVNGDSKWIGQVIDNLLMNALKFSDNGSHVTITGHNKGDVVVVGVIDNGPGIPLEEQKLIFEKFYRGRNHLSRTTGTGLGLAISKSVIEKHGGKIWVESKLGEGSKFFFAMPVAKK